MVHSNWIVQLGHLLARAWFAMVAATSQTTLGLCIWTVGLAAVIWVLTRIFTYLEHRRTFPPNKALEKAFQGALSLALIEGLGILIIALVAWVGFIPVVIYRDHRRLVDENGKLNSQVQNLQIKGPYERSFVGSFALANTILAFNSLRGAPQSVDPNSPCQLKITAAEENRKVSESLGSVATYLGCAVASAPFNLDLDPDDRAAIANSQPNVITIHAARNNTRADGFVLGMSNTFHVRRAYDLPNGSRSDLVWIEIGAGSIWRKDQQ